MCSKYASVLNMIIAFIKMLLPKKPDCPDAAPLGYWESKFSTFLGTIEWLL